MSETILSNTSAKSSFLAKTTHLADTVTATLDFLTPASLLLLRCWVAWQFFKSGLTKTQTASFDWFGHEFSYPTSLLPTENAIFLFQEEYNVPVLPPVPAAYLGTAVELICPILLILGLAGRIGALGLFFLNFVAVISYEFASLKDHLPWGLILLVFVLHGPGKLSIEYWISKLARRSVA
jgi:putative oxidoreductase